MNQFRLTESFEIETKDGRVFRVDRFDEFVRTDELVGKAESLPTGRAIFKSGPHHVNQRDTEFEIVEIGVRGKRREVPDDEDAEE